jgi:hypothetical protein
MTAETTPLAASDSETVTQLQAAIEAARTAIREAALATAQAAFDGNLPEGSFTVLTAARDPWEEHPLHGPVYRMTGLNFGPSKRPQYSGGRGSGDMVPDEARFTGVTQSLLAADASRPLPSEVTLGVHCVDLQEVTGQPVATAYLDGFAITRRDEEGRPEEVQYTAKEKLGAELAFLQTMHDMVVPE